VNSGRRGKKLFSDVNGNTKKPQTFSKAKPQTFSIAKPQTFSIAKKIPKAKGHAPTSSRVSDRAVARGGNSDRSGNRIHNVQ